MAATEITQLLIGLKDGDRAAAAAKLMPLVYDEFRALAARHLKHERRDHSLQPAGSIRRNSELSRLSGNAAATVFPGRIF